MKNEVKFSFSMPISDDKESEEFQVSVELPESIDPEDIDKKCVSEMLGKCIATSLSIKSEGGSVGNALSLKQGNGPSFYCVSSDETAQVPSCRADHIDMSILERPSLSYEERERLVEDLLPHFRDEVRREFSGENLSEDAIEDFARDYAYTAVDSSIVFSGISACS